MSLDPELLSGNLHKCIGKSRNNTLSWTMGCTWGFHEQVEHTFGRLQWHTLSGHLDDFLHTGSGQSLQLSLISLSGEQLGCRVKMH